MIFSIYNNHVIVFDNSDLKTPYTQTFNRPTDWFRNPLGFYLNIACNSTERALFLYPPSEIISKTAWNTDVSDYDRLDAPLAVFVSRAGGVRTVYKRGKVFLSTPISDVQYGQNVLVSNDASTVILDADVALRNGDIATIEEYVRRLHNVSLSSTQGTYAPRAWYCKLDDFRLCLEESGELNFTEIDHRWKPVNFDSGIEVIQNTISTLQPFTYMNLSGFDVKAPEVKNV